MDLSWIWIWIWIEVDMEMTEMAETHVELNQFPVPRVGPRHSTLYLFLILYMHTADTETQQFGFANSAKCGENKALIRQSLIPKTRDWVNLIPGFRDWKNARDPGISGSRD